MRAHSRRNPTLGRTGLAIDAAEYFSNKLEYETTPRELKPRLNKDQVLILDVRDRDAYAKEHIPSARNVPLEELTQNLGRLLKERPIVVYSWGYACNLAPRACLELAERGFKVRLLVGGIEEWMRQGFSVARK
ncbi:MAG: rhodanese-like domain-containing protein [Elusimicrobia bacterium]|nr:rhodanese-like domain-containing protein [Elusimicrobiota bacterium]